MSKIAKNNQTHGHAWPTLRMVAKNNQNQRVMKAIIFDYEDGSLNVLPIPKEWEENADEFVESHPYYNKASCYYMTANNDEFPVYDIVEDGEDDDGVPTYDYIRRTTL